MEFFYGVKIRFALSVYVCHGAPSNRAIFWPPVLHVALYKTVFFDFYSAMHFSAMRGLAIACRPSVCNVGGL